MKIINHFESSASLKYNIMLLCLDVVRFRYREIDCSKKYSMTLRVPKKERNVGVPPTERRVKQRHVRSRVWIGFGIISDGVKTWTFYLKATISFAKITANSIISRIFYKLHFEFYGVSSLKIVETINTFVYFTGKKKKMFSLFRNVVEIK